MGKYNKFFWRWKSSILCHNIKNQMIVKSCKPYCVNLICPIINRNLQLVFWYNGNGRVFMPPFELSKQIIKNIICLMMFEKKRHTTFETPGLTFENLNSPLSTPIWNRWANPKNIFWKTSILPYLGQSALDNVQQLKS